MDQAAIWLMAAMAIGGLGFAVAGLVLVGKALRSQADVVRQQTNKLAELATRKPYWIIEHTERGIEISLLERRLDMLERNTIDIGETTPDRVENAMLEDQWGSGQSIPPMNDDDADDLGTRM